MADLRWPFGGYKPRTYQDRLFKARFRGLNRLCTVWHRRAGKDLTYLHLACNEALTHPGTYYHMLPTFAQGRKVIWDAVTPQGVRVIDAVFPPAVRSKKPNSSDMSVELVSGSRVQVVGSDNYDRLVGTNPRGITFSEFALNSPLAWEFFRPILAENKGWAAFAFTPRGYNHAHDLYQMAKTNADWYCDLQTVKDTQAIPLSLIQQERDAGMPEELIQQEFFCDFSVANVGSIFGRQVEVLDRAGMISDDVHYDPSGAPIEISTDLGFTDATAVWFWQPAPDGYRLLAYDEANGLTADEWADRVMRRVSDNRWKLKTWWLPPDARAKTLQTGRSTVEMLLAAKLPVDVVPTLGQQDMINAGRTVLARCRINRTECKAGLTALRNWCYTYNEETRAYSLKPEHSWASHGGTGFYYGALVMQQYRPRVVTPSQPGRNMESFSLSELWELGPGKRGRV